LNALQLRRSEDAYVEELFAVAPELGAPLLAAEFPRAYIDVNRAPGELDPAMFETAFSLPVGPRTPRVAAGFGVIPRVVREGQEIYGGALEEAEATFRLERFYKPYHAMLAELVCETQERFGRAIVIDCHSMPPSARARDVAIGDCFGAAAHAEFILFVQNELSAVGFRVTRNMPYAGGYTTNLYGQPKENVQALQIEINRALYLDETVMEKTEGFAHTCEKLGRFLARLLAAPPLWRS
jgi:N-formylglutamate deformylase